MPDRLSELLHEVDDLPTALPAPAVVRRRGLRLRRRRQAAAGTGALALVAVVAVGAAALAGDTVRLDPPPAVPATSDPEPAPSPTEELLPDPVTVPTAPPARPSPSAVALEDLEPTDLESDLGYLRGFGNRDGRRTVLIDRVDVRQGPAAQAEARRRGLPDPGPNGTVFINDNPRVREYVLLAEAYDSIAFKDGPHREPREVGELPGEVGESGTLAGLEQAYLELQDGEQILLNVYYMSPDRAVSLLEMALLRSQDL